MTAPTAFTTATTWQDISGTVLDQTIAAQVGDVVEAEAGIEWFSVASSVIACFDFTSIVAAAYVNSWATGVAVNNAHYGGRAFLGRQLNVAETKFGILRKTVEAGDLVSGLITLRPIARMSSAVARNIDGGIDSPSVFFIRNIGPVDPN